METFGERLRKLREEKRLSQQEFAHFMGKANKTVISSWELNKAQPNLSEIQKIADYFNVSIDYLLRGKPNTVEESTGEYVRITKDELINYQKALIAQQQQQLEQSQSQTARLKNIATPVE